MSEEITWSEGRAARVPGSF